MSENVENKPLLTISLLCSGRKETKKCLDSLQPIRDAVPSELILIDTGCSEEMHELLLSYTDQVYPFTWCNDFSIARNEGLKRAKGEWFLYIDDDEWFTDTTDIIEFFTSGEYKKYGIALYIQRNFHNYEGTKYSDAWVSRLVRINENSRFQGTIHEYLPNYLPGYKLLYSPASHFGYIFTDPKVKYNHSKRNVSLLEDIIKKERREPRWWGQLAQEYMGIKENDQLLLLCEAGIKEFKNQKDLACVKLRSTFYDAIMMVQRNRGFYENSMQAYVRSLQDKDLSPLMRGALEDQAAKTCFAAKKYEEAIAHGTRYLKAYDKFIVDDYRVMDEGNFFTRESYMDTNQMVACCMLIGAGLRLGRDKELHEYFDRIGWDKQVIELAGDILKDIVEAIASREYEEFFVHVAKAMIGRKEWKEHVITQLQKIEAGYRLIGEVPDKDLEKVSDEERDERFARIVRVFSQVEDDHYYLLSLKILQADTEGDADQVQSGLNKLFTQVVDVLQCSDKLFELMDRRNVDLMEMIEKISFTRWKKGVDSFCEHANSEKVRARRLWARNHFPKEHLYLQYLEIKSTETAVVYRKKDDPEQHTREYLRERFADYVSVMIPFLHRYYREKAFEGDMPMLSPAERCCIYLEQMLSAEKEGDTKGVLELAKKASAAYQPFARALTTYQEANNGSAQSREE